ncbi:MAG: hypothetical protein ACSLEX_01285 [Minisyncoccota bacterium]
MYILFAIQNILIGISLILLTGIPLVAYFFGIDSTVRGYLFTLSFASVFLVMIIRPFADIFITQLWLRRLVILRKGFGILSASIITGFMITSIMLSRFTYLADMITPAFYSLDGYVLFAHLGDLTGLILLLTSNRLSQKLLKRNWKRVQRLSYVYFYAGGLYEVFALNSLFALYAVLFVTNVTALAWAVKKIRKGTVEMNREGSIPSK